MNNNIKNWKIANIFINNTKNEMKKRGILNTPQIDTHVKIGAFLKLNIN